MFFFSFSLPLHESIIVQRALKINYIIFNIYINFNYIVASIVSYLSLEDDPFMKIAFLSCEEVLSNTSANIQDDQFLISEFSKLGHTITQVAWDANENWKQFDRVIIRTTWDYATRAQEFLKVLEKISQDTKLYNSYETVKWNIHKGYLKTLESKGVTILPTVMFKDTEQLSIPRDWGYEKFVIKPAVSATAYKTMVVTREEIETESYKNALVPGDWLCQPFMPQISQGEISLLYFNKKFSHALLKVPRPGDFRVQIEWGGTIESYTPSPELFKLCENIMKAIPENLLYARIDVIPFENTFALMELELIEPALYFRTSAQAPLNFTKAFLDVEKEERKL